MMDANHKGVEALLDATEPRRSGYGALALKTAAIVAILVLAAMAQRWGLPAAVSMVVPWILVIGLLTAARSAGRRERDVRKSIDRATELVQMEDWEAAGGMLMPLLDRPIRSGYHRGQAFLLWAALADHERRYEAAGEMYEALALRRIGDPLQLQQAGIALATAKLRNGELTDAVTLIGRMERLQMPRALRAACDFVRLFQQVLMGHFEDAAANQDERRAAFRRELSTRAGFAYAMLALAEHYLGRHENARRLWGDATTLIRPERLLADFDILKPVAAAYPATEYAV